MRESQGQAENLETIYQPAFQSMCAVLCGQAGVVDWLAFSPRDWRALGELAEHHGVAPLVYWRLEQAGWPDSAPGKLRHRLSTGYYQSAATSALILGELRGIIAKFQQAGIAVLVLKGAHLAYTIYPEAALRPMSDIDLLVKAEDLPAAEAALASCGYHPSQASVSERLNRQQGHHLHLIKGGGVSPAVELHWELLAGKADQRQVDAGWFWGRVETFNLPEGSAHAQGLDPTASLLYLAAHLFLKHQGSSDRLLWLYDIARLLEQRGEAIDWAAALRQAKALGWGEALHAAFRSAHAELGADLPPEVVAELAEKHPIPHQVRVFRNWSKAELSLANLEKLTPGGRLRQGWAALFPSREHIQRRYQPRPGWLWPLCYPLKWAGMARQAAAAMFHNSKSETLY